MLYALDIDGTLIRSFMRDEPCDVCGGKRRILLASLAEGVAPIDGDYMACPDCVERYDRVELLPGRVERLRQLASDDDEASFALVTNQGGVAFGYQTEDDVTTKLANVVWAVEFFYGRAFSVHVAYGHPRATVEPYADPRMVERRKPSPTMLVEAMAAHRRDRLSTIYVGDRDSDRECAINADVTYVRADVFFRPPLTTGPTDHTGGTTE